MRRDSESDHYPSAREALFGNDHVANLYCATKWFAWHFGHLLLVIAVALFLLLYIPAVTFFSFAVVLVDWMDRRSRDSTLDTTRLETTVSRTGRQMRRNRVTRRIYGECPVDIKMDPRWFERLESVSRAALRKLLPAERVWRCPECGSERNYEPIIGHNYCDGEYERTKKPREFP